MRDWKLPPPLLFQESKLQRFYIDTSVREPYNCLYWIKKYDVSMSGFHQANSDLIIRCSSLAASLSVPLFSLKIYPVWFWPGNVTIFLSLRNGCVYFSPKMKHCPSAPYETTRFQCSDHPLPFLHASLSPFPIPYSLSPHPPFFSRMMVFFLLIINTPITFRTCSRSKLIVNLYPVLEEETESWGKEKEGCGWISTLGCSWV